MTTAPSSAALEAPATREIRELPDRVAAQIAAGEVIERPAAVLKELLENALDAGARRISVEVEAAGQGRIAVHDDGCGIPPEQLELAFRRHATSKLRQVDDLGRLMSYGFRGEALPAIAAAAGRLTVVTRARGEESARQIEFEGGVPAGPRPAARDEGTTVELVDLFASQPARRAFLAGARAERTALLRAASDVVLARPDVSLSISIDGRTPLSHEAVFGLDDESALRAAAASVFSTDAARRAVWVAGDSPTAELSVSGLAGAPDDARRTRDRIRLFANGRPIHDRRLTFAVGEAYREWLGAGEFPLAVVRLSVPPDAIDVNIHPAKTEVRLRDADAAFSLIQRGIRTALLDARDAQARRFSPAADSELEFASDATYPRLRPGTAPSSAPGVAPDVELDRDRSRPPAPTPRTALPPSRSPESAVAEAAAQPELERPAGLPPLRVVGQLHRTFIIAEGPDGLVLVDQHGAHERVIYERLLAGSSEAGLGARVGGNARGRQPLLEPLVLQLDAEEAASWEDAAEQLLELGFDAEPFGGRALRLRALPAALNPARAERLVRGVLSDLGPGSREPERFDRAAASAACHSSVRRGQALDQPALAALLRDLERCRQPHTCPHGRPTLVEISADDLLREFRRK